MSNLIKLSRYNKDVTLFFYLIQCCDNEMQILLRNVIIQRTQLRMRFSWYTKNIRLIYFSLNASDSETFQSSILSHANTFFMDVVTSNFSKTTSSRSLYIDAHFEVFLRKNRDFIVWLIPI